MIVSRSVAMSAGQTVTVSLFQPPVPVQQNELGVEVDGVEKPVRISLQTTFDQSGVHGYGRYAPHGLPTDRPAVLLSRAVPQDFRDLVEKKAASGAASSGPSPPSYGSSGSEKYALLRSELPVSQWSPNWLAYSCYDAIILSGDEADGMPPPVQLAIRRYLECGGTVIVHGTKVPDSLAQGSTADSDGGRLVGFGYLAATPAKGKVPWQGTCDRLDTLTAHRAPALHTFPDTQDRLVKSTTVPVHAMFTLLVLFAIGVGPINVWLLSRCKRRIWLWWNVPAASLAMCLAVFLYATFSEGWTGHGKAASLTLLDERSHRATTIGYLSYYCPLTPSRGLHFDLETEVTLLPNSYDPYAYAEESRSLRLVDWTSDQAFGAGWVNARVPAYFQVRKNQNRRERLNVRHEEDGKLVVLNALGADIRHVYLADATGRIFQGRDIRAGAEAALEPAAGPVPKPEAVGQAVPDSGSVGQAVPDSGSSQAQPDLRQNAKRGMHELRQIYAASDWLNALRIASGTSQPPPLARGTYVAVLERSPFLESPMPGVDCPDTAAVVYGISRGPDDGR